MSAQGRPPHRAPDGDSPARGTAYGRTRARSRITAGPSLAPFVAPRYWPTWLLWLALRAVAALPFRAQLAVGRALGRAVPLVMRRQHRIAARNLELCFPGLSDAERARLLARHCEAVGMSFVEMGIGWFAPLERLRRLVRVEGREHLDRARAQGPVIVLSAHFTTLEVGLAMLEDLAPGIAGMYRPQRNAMADAMIRRGRSRFADEQIPRDNVRALLKALKAGGTVTYIPDQTHVGNQSALLPFFGEPARTNVAASKLARISGARIVPYLFRRLPGAAGYVVTVLPPLEGVPSEDPVSDTRQWLDVLEDHIRLAPEQYLWIYKKFKYRPPPLSEPYRDI